ARPGRRDPRHPGRDGPFPTSSRDARAACGARRRRPIAGPGGCPMSTDLDATRIVRSWLRTDEHESADRLLDNVLALLDATPQHRARWPVRRFAQMKSYAKLAIAAAAVVAVALVGINLLPRSGSDVGGGIAPTATPSPSPSPTPTPTP